MRALSLRYSARTNAEISNTLSLNAFNNYLYSPYLDQIKNNSGDLITKFNYFNKLFSGILMPLLYFIIKPGMDPDTTYLWFFPKTQIEQKKVASI